MLLLFYSDCCFCVAFAIVAVVIVAVVNVAVAIVAVIVIVVGDGDFAGDFYFSLGSTWTVLYPVFLLNLIFFSLLANVLPLS